MTNKIKPCFSKDVFNNKRLKEFGFNETEKYFCNCGYSNFIKTSKGVLCSHCNMLHYDKEMLRVLD